MLAANAVAKHGFSRLAHALVLSCLMSLGSGVARAADAASSPLDRVAREVERTEAIRAVRALQHSYSQYAQYGLWNDLGTLFSEDAEAIYGTETIRRRTAITQYHMSKFGAGRPGLPANVVNTHFVDVPLVNLSVDGNSARARWYGFSMLGGTSDARWDSGTFENEYVRENGVWKISRLHYHPQFGGAADSGWRTYTNPLPLVPYHFRTEAEAGTPVPPAVGPAPRTTATLASLEQRVERLNAEDKVRNLQNAYGYYIDRKMWDDVTDLFTADGVLELGGIGIYERPAGIRRALERNGTAGLQNGQLNEHPQFDMTVEIAANGVEARVRGLELGLLGDYGTGTAQWSVRVFHNHFVKQDGVWRIREMRLFPVLKTDYYQGWGTSRIVDAVPSGRAAPDRPVPAADAGDNVIPAFLANPVTGRQVTYPPGAKVAARTALLPALRAAAPAAAAGNDATRIAELERKLALSRAYDGALNMTAAYTYYIDDGQWTSMGAIFAEHGHKQVPFNGYYIGPERIAHRPGVRPAPNSTNPGRGGWHWLMQPVIDVAPDGRSAKMRSRLLHPFASATGGGGIEGGMYPNNQAVLENGVWKLWTVTIDEPYFSGYFPGGWARPRQAAARPAAPAGAPATRPATPAPAAAAQAAPALPTIPGAVIYPPNIPQILLGKRMEGFRGGTGETITWPGILPMWFHYRNPVSGRQPERYWPDCGPCEYAPYLSMDKYGYLLPP